MMRPLAAFGLVVVQNGHVGLAGEDEIEPPGETLRVSDARTHALTEKGRHLMGAIAGEDDASVAPLLRPEPVESVVGDAYDVDRIEVEERAQLLAHERRIGGFALALVAHDHELPLVVGADNRHVSDGLARVADLLVNGGEARVLAAATRLGVDDHPRLVEIGGLQRQLRRLAHEAAAAVATDEIPRGDGDFAPVGADGDGANAVGGLRHLRRFEAAQRDDVGKSLQALLEMALEGRLMEPPRAGVAIALVL